MIEYHRWWEKVVRELTSYHRGQGIAMLESLDVLQGEDLAECWRHSRRVSGTLKHLCADLHEDWAKRLTRKAKSWAHLLSAVVDRVGLREEKASALLLRGALTVEEAEFYVGRVRSDIQ